MTDVGKPSTEVYRQSIEKLPRAVGRAYRGAALWVVLGTFAAITLATPFPQEPGDRVDLGLILALVGFLVAPYFMWRAGRRVRRYWNAFELSIGADSMRVAAKGSGRVSIKRALVKEITEDTDGLEVRSSDGVLARVPTTAEGYVDARARLAAWHPIQWRIYDLRSCLALVVTALIAGGIILVIPKATRFSAVMVLCHLVGSTTIASEVRANPALSTGRKTLSIVVALGSTMALFGAAVLVALR